MKVIERVEQLQAELQDITEKYCDYCQEFLCEECKKEWKGDEVVAHCNLKENAELIAKILDADVNGEVWRGEEDEKEDTRTELGCSSKADGRYGQAPKGKSCGSSALPRLPIFRHCESAL